MYERGSDPPNWSRMCTASGLKLRSKIPRRSSRLQRQRLASRLLDASTAAYVAHYLYRNPSYLNPWHLPNAGLWCVGFVAIRLGVLFYDHLVVLLIERCVRSPVLPSRREGAPPVRYVGLDALSLLYLSLNAFNEYAFVMRLTHYLWSGGHQAQLPWHASQLTPGNTLVALGVMFVAMDLLYAPLHHLLHLPALYPLIHKHHHRQHFPARGYLDAGNEHPIEHMIGVACTWFAVCAAEVFLPTCGLWLGKVTGGDTTTWTRGGGVHALTVLLFFQAHAALACLNHSPYDVQFSLPVLGSARLFGALDDTTRPDQWMSRILAGQWFHYSVGHHEMHHRKFRYNYGQYCMLYDMWMGTFLEYEGAVTATEIKAGKKTQQVAK